MSQVKDFYEMFAFTEFVIDENRTVGQLPYAGARANAAAHPGKPRQQLDMVEQGVAETLGGIGIICGDVADYLGQVV